MVLNEEQIAELEAAAVPLVKFINDNCHPHVKVIVHAAGAEVVEGLATVRVPSTYITLEQE